jgi:hypothetical protein
MLSSKCHNCQQIKLPGKCDKIVFFELFVNQDFEKEIGWVKVKDSHDFSKTL